MGHSVGQKVWKININKNKDSPNRWSLRQDGVHVEELTILGISKHKIVLDNDFFTTLDVVKTDQKIDVTHYNYLDREIISIVPNSSLFSEGIFCTLYSTKPPDKKLLNSLANKIGKKVYKDYGYLFGGAIEELKTLIKKYDAQTEKTTKLD